VASPEAMLVPLLPVGPVGSPRSYQEHMSDLFGPGGYSTPVSMHRSAALRVIMPDRYRVDVRAGQRRNSPATIACDGQRLGKLHGNRLVMSPAQPPPPEYARLLEPARLLSGWRLSEAGRTRVNGRTAVRVFAVPPSVPGFLDEVAWRMVLLIDADLGFLLRQVTYARAAPAARFELRDLHVDPADPGDFGVEVPPGIRVVESGGDLWHEVDLPGPVLAAGEAAGAIVRGMVSAASWLVNARRRR
jgi:hypothetical protein